jgi:hypothetical protein
VFAVVNDLADPRVKQPSIKRSWPFWRKAASPGLSALRPSAIRAYSAAAGAKREPKRRSWISPSSSDVVIGDDAVLIGGMEIGDRCVIGARLGG